MSPSDRELLDGRHGEGAAFAMRIVLRAAEVTGADRLIDVTRAHIDSCLYHGEASLDFVRRLVDGDARVRIPTTLNVGALDLMHPQLYRGDPRTAERGRLLMERYRALGARPTFTCAPYQLPDARPSLGEQVAWGESNAIAFCNSVLGARTNRYGDFIDVAAAITGRVPDAGLHRTDARRATLVLRLADDIPQALRDADVLAPVLGIVLGRRAGSSIAAIDGLPPGQSEDRLKAIGAAAASSGSVAMFHVVGSTPEAATLDDALQHRAPERVELIRLAELRAVRDELTTDHGDGLAAVSLGTPHASLEELERYAAMLGGRRVHRKVECLVSTGRDVLAAAAERGIVARLRDAGVELLVDTCSYIAPILRNGAGPVMTDSGKWAYYAPGNIGSAVVFGSSAECIRSAVAGHVVRDLAPWGGA
ncbi:MAG TPA: aconitase X catalytic domain-containing protein [Candidatus Limnocylindrales bacterium]|nr:aconitase X catalytic domain-containing protein [Candidatus Limnocylindrales bacterium]